MYRFPVAGAVILAALGCTQATDSTAPATSDQAAGASAGEMTTVDISVPGMT